MELTLDGKLCESQNRVLCGNVVVHSGKIIQNTADSDVTMQCLRKTILSCAQLSYTYEEKTEVQTIGMYNKHTKISKTNFLY